jgi:hypothetical protein
MPIDRRTVLLASGALLMSRYVWAADDENALFWLVTPQGRKSAVLFGYERVAPAVVPDLIRDGDALVSACDRVVLDMPQDVRFPSVGAARPQMKPIVQIVSPATADRLRKFLVLTPVAAMGDRVSGLEATILLMGEGQHDATSTAAGTIVDHARSFGKPVDQLVSEAEILSAWQAPDLAGLNDKIGEETIVYMLDLRDKVGPIGGYLEQLYRQRRANEIERVTADMSRHGVMSPAQFIQTDKVRELMFARALDMLTRQVDALRFMAFPLGILTGSSGILAALDAKGVPVTGRA